MKRIIFTLFIVVICVSGPTFAAAGDADGYPHVVSTSPADGQNGVSLGVRINVVFSEPIDPDTVTTDTFLLSADMGTAVSGEVSASGNSATFIPFTTFDEMTTYNATVTTGILSRSGESLMRDYTWSFTTTDD